MTYTFYKNYYVQIELLKKKNNFWLLNNKQVTYQNRTRVLLVGYKGIVTMFINNKNNPEVYIQFVIIIFF